MTAHLVSLIGLAVVLFVSTNIDDVFVLLACFADPTFKVRQIVIGQLLGIAALYGASVVASLISLVIPAAYIGLLGLAPIVIGLKKAWDLRQGVAESEEEAQGAGKASGGHGNVIAVVLITLANGGDNISIYTPMFATRSGYDVAFFGVSFAILTLVWVWAAHWLTRHPTLGAPIRRYGHRVVPYVLIALGVLILHEAGTLELLRP